MISAPRRVLTEACIILSIASGPFLFGAVEPWSEALLVFFCAAAFLACGDAAMKGRIGWAVPGLFGGAAALALLQGFLPAPAWGPAAPGLQTASQPGSWAAAAKFLACAALALSCRGHFGDESGRRRVAWLLLASGAALALIGLLQLADGNARLYGLRWYQSRVSPFGPFYNRNHAAAWLTMCLLAGGGLALERARHEDSRSRADFASELAVIACLLVLVGMGLIATRSRGALAALAAGGVVFAFYRRRLTVTVIAAAIAFAALGVWIGRSKGGLASSFDQRRLIYDSTRTLIADFPAFGRGVGAYEALMPAYQARTPEGAVRQAHSDPLQWIAEAGVPLFSAVLLVSACIITASMRRELDPVMAGLAAAAFAFIAHGLFDFGGQIFGLFVPFAAIWALAPSSPAFEAECRPPIRGFAMPVLRGLLCLAVIGMAARAAALPLGLGAGLTPMWSPPRWCVAAVDPAYAAVAAGEAALNSGERQTLYAALAAVERQLSAHPFKHRLHSVAGRLLRALGRAGDADARDEAARMLRHG